MRYLTPNEVLLLHPVAIKVVIADQVILFISVGHPARNLVCHVTEKDPTDMVIIESISDLATISESHLSEADASNITILNTCMNFVLYIAIHSVEAIRTIDKNVRARRMMCCLLKENFRTILTYGLVSLAKNWIEWLVENLVI